MLSRAALIALTGLVAAGMPQNDRPTVVAPDRLVAARVPQNPLITVKSSPSLGDNVNGPSVIRVPPWVKAPLGRYYMYFAHHYGRFIRLAYADSVTGPWKIYESGVLPIEHTGFNRPQPDPPGTGASQRMHVASPDVHIDMQGRKILMWVHGWWTNNESWPNTDPKSAATWARDRGYEQYTQVATSADGIHFETQQPVTRTSYLRVFQWENSYYGLARLGLLARSREPLNEFELGPNPFTETDYRNRVRHVALLRRGTQLYVFFSAIGDAPERILMSTLDLRGGWETWKASPPVAILRPERDYECVDLPNEASRAGEIVGPARQLRDPAILEDEGRVWLFYTICGEQGIAVAELTHATAALTTYRIAPKDVDPSIERYNEPHVVVFDRATGPAAKLLLVMPGTGASPASLDEFVTLAATLGYRVISLSYNNRPPAAAVCPKDPDAGCFGKFRTKRIFGENVTTHIDDKAEESIVHRLVKLLNALHKDHPAENWARYLDGDTPRWERIAVAGHSMGAGMAAYIAQRKQVARVVLLSGPEDAYGIQGAGGLAPWVRDGNGVTPAALWFAAYHSHENRARQIALAYEALTIPKANVRVLALEPAETTGNDPYHWSVVMSRATPRNANGGAAYEDAWRFLLQSPN